LDFRRAQVFNDESGQPLKLVGVNIDITERKQAEDRERLLANELAHRTKNLLAVVQAIVSRSLSGTRSLAEARDVLIKRIHALAGSQTALAHGGTEGAPLAEIVSLELQGFSDRVTATGPVVSLKARAAETFALLLHELATNATKYGALSRPGGRVAIDWTIVNSGTDARFRFQWQERGGPLVSPPTRKGFGRTLIEIVAAQAFSTEPKMSFAPEGLTYDIDAPLVAVVASTVASGTS
jgi:two-component sensor histidine kinase